MAIHIVTSRTRASGNRAPKGPVALNKDSSLARDLAFAFVYRAHGPTFVPYKPAYDTPVGKDPNGPIAPESNKVFDGWGQSWDSSTYYYGHRTAPGNIDPASVSFVFFCEWGSSWNRLGGPAYPGSGNSNMIMLRDASLKVQLWGNNGSSASINGITIPAQGDPVVVGASIDSSTTARLYVNGKQEGGTAFSIGTAQPTWVDFAWGGSPNNPIVNSYAWGGSVGFGAIWRRPLSASDHWSLYDPQTRWDLYWQRKRTYFMPAAAAGGSFSAALTLSAQLSHGPTVLMTTPQAVSFGTQLSKATSTIGTFGAGTSLDLSVSQADTVIGTFGTDTTFGLSLSQTDTAILAGIEAATSFSLSLDLTDATTMLTDQLATLASKYGLSTTTVWTTNPTATLQATFGVTDTASVNTQGATTFSTTHGITTAGGLDLSEAISLALSVGQQSSAIITIEGNLTLGTQLSVTDSVVANFAGNALLGVTVDLANNAVADLTAAAALGTSLGQTFTSGTTIEGGTTLSVSLTHTATAVVGTVTVTTPDWRTLEVTATPRTLSILSTPGTREV